MNKWQPDNNPHQARRLGKTGEEVSELGAVLFRISIQGLDAIDPSSGKTNRQRLLEETADVSAQLEVNFRTLYTQNEQNFIHSRAAEKVRQMDLWEEHYSTGAESPVVAALRAARVYVKGAYECAFPDSAANHEVLQIIDEAIKAAQ